MPQAHITILVELPPGADREAPEVLAARLRLLWALDEVRRGRMTRVRAAQVVGMPLDAFLSEAASHDVPAIDYDLDDFKRELSSLT